MANEIAKLDERNIWEQYGDEESRSTIIGKILKLAKSGEFTAGQEQEEVPLGTQLIANMNSIRIGWIKWVDAEVAGREMGYLGEYKPPSREELGDLDKDLWEDPKKDPWQKVNEIIMFDPDSEELYTYSASSKGGIGAVAELNKTYGRHVRLHGGGVFPVVKLEVGSYMHSNRSYGKIYFPKFTVVDFVKPPKPLLEAQPNAEEVEEDEPPPPKKVQPKLVTKGNNKKSPPRKGMRF
jgi:hypothetical protein